MNKIVITLLLIFSCEGACYAQKDKRTKHETVFYYRPPMVNIDFSKNYYWIVNEKEGLRYGKPLHNKLYSGTHQNYYASKLVLDVFQGFNRPIPYIKIKNMNMPDTVTNVVMDVGFVDVVEKIEGFEELSERSTTEASGKLNYKEYSYKLKVHVPLKLVIETKKWVGIDPANENLVKTVKTILFTKDELASSYVHEFEYPKYFGDFSLRSKKELEAHYNINRKAFLLKVKQRIFDTFLYRCKKEFISKYIGVKGGVVGGHVFVIKDKDGMYDEVNNLALKFNMLVKIISDNNNLNNRKNWHTKEAKGIIAQLLLGYTALCDSKNEKYSVSNVLCFKRNRVLMLFFDCQFNLANKEIDELIFQQEVYNLRRLNKGLSKKERKAAHKIYYFMKDKFKLAKNKAFMVDYEKRYNVFKNVLGWN